MEGAVEPELDVDPVIDGWALEAISRLGRLAGVHRIGLALAEGGGRRLRFTASDRMGDGVARWCLVDAYADVPLNHAIRAGTVVNGALEDLRASFPDFVTRQAGTPTLWVSAVPITAAAQVLGGFVLFHAGPPRPGETSPDDLRAEGAELGRRLRMAQRQRVRGLEEWTWDTAPDGRSARHDLPQDPHSVREARSFLHRTLVGWGVAEELIDTAAFCLSELVTNAVVHGSGGCSVRVSEESGVITVAVRDAGSRGVMPRVGTGDPLAVHGRGLRIVDELASRWGSDVSAAALTVWFVLDG